MRVEVEIRGYLMVEVTRGGEDSVRQAALDWLLRFREGDSLELGPYKVKGMSGEILDIRPWKENPKFVWVTTEKGFFG